MNFLYFIISLIASTVGAISGIGGGVIIKPVMDVISPFDVSVISFLSGTTVLSMSVVSIIRSRKNTVKVDKKKSMPIAIGGIAGGIAGKNIFDLIKNLFENDAVLGASQSIILTAITLGVVIFTLNRDKIKSLNKDSTMFCFFVGVLLGVLSSFLGIGGGPINIAVFSYFFSMNSKESAINSIYVIFFSQLATLIMTLATNTVPQFEPWVLGLMIVGGILGALVGSAITKKLSPKGVSNVFVGVMIIIIALSLYNFFGFINQ